MNGRTRKRARDIGVAPGQFPTGRFNAITDVPGVMVGQVTLFEGEHVRTGVTAVLPHAGNLFQEKTPAGLAVANGFGKLVGATQIVELGEVETPIVLTNTLSVPEASRALIDWTLRLNPTIKSVNAVVGETNDGFLNAIHRQAVTREHVLSAINQADGGEVDEGAVGAGTGTVAFGWKGGIGTSSRCVGVAHASCMVGVLVQSNFGGALRIAGAPIGELLARHRLTAEPNYDGSIMILVATDAPLSDRNLQRLAWRTFAGVARTGSSFANGSGDYAIAVSCAPEVRRTPQRRREVSSIVDIPNALMTPLFAAVADATEEAIYNSLLQAIPVESRDVGSGQPIRVPALDPDAVADLLTSVGRG